MTGRWMSRMTRIGLHFPEELDALPSVGSEGDFEAFASEVALESLSNQPVVVDDQDGFHGVAVIVSCASREGTVSSYGRRTVTLVPLPTSLETSMAPR